MIRSSQIRSGSLAVALAVAMLLAEAFVGRGGQGERGIRLGSSCFAKTTEGVPQYITPDIFANIAERTLPSVVSVYVKYDVRAQIKDFRKKMEPFKDFFDDPQFKKFFKDQPQGEGQDEKDNDKDKDDDPHGDMQESRTSGSGIIITKDGYILTNNHIVGGAKEGTISVVLNDDKEIPPDKVKIVAVDTYLDLGIIKIDPTGLDLNPISWGNSDEMRIGDWVLAIGNPLDLRGSVSKGIISAKTRKIGKVPIEHLLQTDAMINPGNSGGALVNLKGELIGVNMAIATNSGFFQGIGFAIPSNDAKFIADQVIKDGKIRRGYIGIWMKPMEDKMLRKAMGIKDTENGILVEGVTEGAPAAAAGVEAYDIITAVDGVKVKDNGDLLGMIAGKRVGDTAQLTILRDVKGSVKEMGLKLKVTERPPDEELATQRQRPAPATKEKPQESKEETIGLSLKPYAQGAMKGLEVTSVEPKSPAAKAGLQVGDVILDFNRKSVASLEEFERAMTQAEEGRPYLIRYFSQVQGRSLITHIEHHEKKS